MKATNWILILLCLILAGILIWRHQSAVAQAQSSQATIYQLSNQWVQTSTKLSEQQQATTRLETNLAFRSEELTSLSNKLESVSAALARNEAQAKAAQQAAQEEMAKRDAKIANLESQRDDLSDRMTRLSGSLTNLEGRIRETQRKLAASEGDRQFLLKELNRLQAEKAELERQMSDLAFLRSQVHKLRNELAVSRRLDWLRRGLLGFARKGGEILQNGFATPTARTNYNLNVEFKRQGGARVVPAATNAPAKTNTNPGR
jgi:chromosome segregation ATPase